MQTLETAQNWIGAGFSVIPIAYRSKRPAFDALKLAGCLAEDGHISWEAFKQRPASDAELKLWFSGPRRNIGVVTGWHGLVVLDFDQRDAYSAWLSWARANGCHAASLAAGTYRVFSARGVHVYVICDEPVESYQVGNIDVKARYGYVLAPPSVHPNGHEYQGQGGRIMRCTKLLDVFPFEKPAPEMGAALRPGTEDPWEAASHAVRCGRKGAAMKAKQAVRIETLLGLDPRRTRQMVLCPLHSDSNPSMLVELERQRFKCFGCGASGDALDLYAAMHKITLREAIAQLGGK